MFQNGFFESSLQAIETPYLVSYPAYVYVCTTIDLTTTTVIERSRGFDLTASLNPLTQQEFIPPCCDHPAGGVIAHFINSLSHLKFLPPGDPKVKELRHSIACDALSMARLNLAIAPSDLRALLQLTIKQALNTPELRNAVMVIADNSQSCFNSHALSKIMQDMVLCHFSEREIDFSLQRFIKTKWLDLSYDELLHLARAARVSSLKWPSIYGRMAELLQEREFIHVEALVEGLRQAGLSKLFQDSVLNFFRLCEPIIMQQLHLLRISSVAEIFRSFGTVHLVSGMTARLLEIIERSIELMNFKDIKRTLSGMAELGIGHEQILARLRGRLTELCEQKKVEERDMVKIIWSFAVAGGGKNMESVWPFLQNFPAKKLRPEVLRLIYQSSLISGLILPEKLNHEVLRAESENGAERLTCQTTLNFPSEKRSGGTAFVSNLARMNAALRWI